MSLEQQIRQCEEKISDLEDWKRSMATGDIDLNQRHNYEGNVDMDLDKEYEHIALLKIRKMMGY